MKKLYLVSFVLLLFTTHVFSQTLSINAGILRSNFYNTYKGHAPEYWLNNHTAKLGYSIGFKLHTNLPDEDLSIESNLLYTSFGSKYHFPDRPIPDAWGLVVRIPLSLKLHYVALPVLLRYNLSEKINVKIGPQIAYLISKNVIIDSPISEGVPLHEIVEFYREIEWEPESNFDYGVNAGIGYVINPGFDISLNFFNGFGTVKKVECSHCPGPWEINYKNRYLTLSVDYTLYRK